MAALQRHLLGQAYRQMIFFENKESFDKFTGGNFEFGAQATAVAITAAASASTSTAGSGTSASGIGPPTRAGGRLAG